MRTRVCVIGAGLLMLIELTGCGGDAAASDPPPPAPVVSNYPAAAAGGACLLLDFPEIEKVVGGKFDVAAASRHQGTYTCVVQAEEASRPDLTLSVTETLADAAIFRDDLEPKGAETVKGLGKAAYRLIVAPGKGYGAGVEVGWLSSDGRLLNLRYTLAAGQGKAAAETVAPKIVALAKKINSTSL